MDFNKLLTFAVQQNASDIHIQAGLKPILRLGGVIRATDAPPTTDEQVRAFITAMAPKRFHANIDDRLVAGLDFSYALPGVSRFRCSAYSQLNVAGISMRVIKSKIPSIA